jgi:hypothetical protein
MILMMSKSFLVSAGLTTTEPKIPQSFRPVERIFKEPSKFATPAIKKRAERGISLGLGPPPQARNTSEEIRSYYLRLANREEFEPDKNLKNARQYLKAIERIFGRRQQFFVGCIIYMCRLCNQKTKEK